MIPFQREPMFIFLHLDRLETLSDLHIPILKKRSINDSEISESIRIGQV